MLLSASPPQSTSSVYYVYFIAIFIIYYLFIMAGSPMKWNNVQREFDWEFCFLVYILDDYSVLIYGYYFLSAILYPWLDIGLPPCCPQAVWSHWGEIERFFTTLAQDGLAEYDQPGKNPLTYSAMAGNWTRATGRTDCDLLHCAIMTGSMYIYRNIFYRLSGLEILNTIRYSWFLLMREERWSVATAEWSWP